MTPASMTRCCLDRDDRTVFTRGVTHGDALALNHRNLNHRNLNHRNLLSDLMVWTIRGYQKLISRYTPPSCRFHPTCSSYAVTALKQHGVLYGSWLSFFRLMRCQPFHPGGYDPVPAPRPRSGESVD